jgi:hypothetical protein
LAAIVHDAAMLFKTCFAFGIFLVACSSSGAGAPDAMAPTTTTTGGAGGGASASAQGALSLYLTTVPNAMPGVACPSSPHWVNVPFTSHGGQQTTGSMKGAIGVDGTDQIAISCSVKKASNGFDVSASLHSPAIDPVSGSPVNPTLVTLSTSIAEGQTAPGTVTVLDSKTASQYESANEAGMAGATCTFSVAPLQPGDQLGVTDGRIWAGVTCPKFRDTASSDLNEACAITTGYFVLENCAR